MRNYWGPHLKQLVKWPWGNQLSEKCLIRPEIMTPHYITLNLHFKTSKTQLSVSLSEIIQLEPKCIFTLFTTNFNRDKWRDGFFNLMKLLPTLRDPPPPLNVFWNKMYSICFRENVMVHLSSNLIHLSSLVPTGEESSSPRWWIPVL